MEGSNVPRLLAGDGSQGLKRRRFSVAHTTRPPRVTTQSMYLTMRRKRGIEHAGHSEANSYDQPEPVMTRRSPDLACVRGRFGKISLYRTIHYGMGRRRADELSDSRCEAILPVANWWMIALS